MHKLMELAKYLRNPDNGCPWDRAQTFDTFKHCLLDEAQEAIAAIEKKDFLNLKEELGDTLFNLIFITNLAEEQGLFTLDDVIDGVYQKMITRHPHVFGDKKAKTPEEAYAFFQEAKKKAKVS